MTVYVVCNRNACEARIRSVRRRRVPWRIGNTDVSVFFWGRPHSLIGCGVLQWGRKVANFSGPEIRIPTITARWPGCLAPVYLLRGGRVQGAPLLGSNTNTTCARRRGEPKKLGAAETVAPSVQKVGVPRRPCLLHPPVVPHLPSRILRRVLAESSIPCETGVRARVIITAFLRCTLCEHEVPLASRRWVCPCTCPWRMRKGSASSRTAVSTS